MKNDKPKFGIERKKEFSKEENHDEGEFGTRQGEHAQESIGKLKTLPKSDQDQSTERMETLKVNIFQSIENTIGESEQPFTFYEIMDCLLKVSYSYNKRFLDDQFKKEPNEIEVTDSKEVTN